ncbi:MAG: glycerophosphodiester phosphodiesterase [Clostridia bacterium]|nr:glycerophosphodiester phosphodiesterase [Clostridia bacterium]
MKKLLKTAAKAALVGAGLYAWAQAPRRSHPAMDKLKKYRYAHRGLHDLTMGIPENTLPAFQRAVDHGFGAELDVHLTRDGQLVVIHDSQLERLCDRAKVVEDLTYEELAAMPILGTEHCAPLLQDVLKIFEGKTPLIVELKTWQDNADALSAAVNLMLKTYEGDYCIESFDPRVVRWFRNYSPETVRGQLSYDYARGGSSRTPVEQFALTHMLCNHAGRPDFVAYNYGDRHTLPVQVSCGVLGAQEVSWTIRTIEDMHAAEAAGAIVIFENFIPEA